MGKISDTTLASDLNEQKHLYASLGIPEYWVIDVKGERVFAFQLNEHGEYEQSRILEGLSIDLLTQAVQKLSTEANTAVAAGFARAIAQ